MTLRTYPHPAENKELIDANILRRATVCEFLRNRDSQVSLEEKILLLYLSCINEEIDEMQSTIDLDVWHAIFRDILDTFVKHYLHNPSQEELNLMKGIGLQLRTTDENLSFLDAMGVLRSLAIIFDGLYGVQSEGALKTCVNLHIAKVLSIKGKETPSRLLLKLGNRERNVIHNLGEREEPLYTAFGGQKFDNEIARIREIASIFFRKVEKIDFDECHPKMAERWVQNKGRNLADAINEFAMRPDVVERLAVFAAENDVDVMVDKVLGIKKELPGAHAS